MGKKMRLPNGYGSVYKLSGNNRRKPYAVAITAGYTEQGKRLRKIIGYAENRIDGLTMLSDYNKSPYDIDLKNLTFNDVWAEVIKEIKTLVANEQMSLGNQKCLESAYAVHCTEIHDRKLMNLKKKELQSLIDNSGLKRTGKGHIKTICVKVYNYAISEYEMPIKNIAIELNAGDKSESEAKVPFNDEELNTLWSHSSDDLVKIILILCYSGMRPGELFKIDIDNIHFDEDYMFGGSKTRAGRNRVIPIHPRIKPFIKYFIDNRKSDYCFKDFTNDFNYQRFTRLYRKCMENLNMKHTPYECRHTFITRMKQANANENLLKIIVGHSIQDITERVYTHRKIEELIEEVRRIK